jgi:hypothetical protein
MRMHRVLAPAAIVIAATLSACGSSGGGGGDSSFAGSVQDTCRTMARGLRNLDAPVKLKDFATVSDDASTIFQDGGAALKKLKAPSKLTADFKELQSNFSDAVNLFDEIGSAAKKGDDATVTTKISSLSKLDADNSALAKSLDASACALDPVFTTAPPSTATPTTVPVVTSAPTTVPPVTEAPTTVPVVTSAPTTVPVATEVPTTVADTGDNKVLVQVAAKLTPKGNYTFSDAGDDKVTLIRTAFNLSPTVAAQPGNMFGVDVTVGGVAITRIFAFVPTADTLSPGTTAELTTTLAGTAPTTPLTVGTLTGVQFTSGENLFFLSESNNDIILAVGKDQQSLLLGVQDFVDSALT